MSLAPCDSFSPLRLDQAPDTFKSELLSQIMNRTATRLKQGRSSYTGYRPWHILQTGSEVFADKLSEGLCNLSKNRGGETIISQLEIEYKHLTQLETDHTIAWQDHLGHQIPLMDRENKPTTKLVNNSLTQCKVEWDKLDIKGTVRTRGECTPSLAIGMSTCDWDQEPDASFIRDRKETIGSNIKQAEGELRELNSRLATSQGSEELVNLIWWKRYELDRLKASEYLLNHFEVIS
ncbi:hypothetical protein I302_101349 [Kwoniella bestiolae CBS 10118]|uniref:Uncharacterized protein n=1 Tax=Kwoniella bestiolae CBS 10118 TaxID=1296100 RepID=A0A1B9GBZ9_9TREE|nr:hypothetical protein I302_00032 [Kwoniella bestiolae CBS 10118]OCF28545.1 hypothetical protein I302_00032 [Kwoniella bestiolae CBS 10118]